MSDAPRKMESPSAKPRNGGQHFAGLSLAQVVPRATDLNRCVALPHLDACAHALTQRDPVPVVARVHFERPETVVGDAGVRVAPDVHQVIPEVVTCIPEKGQ